MQNQTVYSVPTTNENAIAIVGFVLAFFVPLAGLICSIIGYNNSKKGGKYGSLALAGIVIGAVFLVIEVILLVFITMYISRYYNPFYYLFYY